MCSMLCEVCLASVGALVPKSDASVALKDGWGVRLVC